MIRYHARYVVPVAGPPFEDGCVAVDGEHIAFVGAASVAPPGTDVLLGDAVLMPGLVNVHTHLELSMMRGFLERLDFRDWIHRLTSAKREVLDRAQLLDAARLGILEGLRAGITTYADTSDADVVLDAMRDHGVRGIVFQEVFGPDPAQCVPAITELESKIARMRQAQTALVRVGISPHAPFSVSDDLFRAAAALARHHGLPLAVHIAESEAEEQLVLSGSGPFADALRSRGIAVTPRGRSSVDLLRRVGVLEANPLLIHCIHVDAEDLRDIARCACSVAHCPASNAKLGHGVAPLIAMLAAGIPIGLGSDSVASNNRMNLLEEARVAILLQRAALKTSDILDGAAAFEMATLGGARALGLADHIGSLEIGKAADLAAFAIDQMLPVYDPREAAVFSGGGSPATFVAVAGRVLVRNGELVSQDAELTDRVQRSASNLRRWLSNRNRQQ